MMQFFRSAAKPLILVTTIAFFIWLVYDLSGLGSGGGLLTKTSVGKINGISVDARTFQAAVQQATEARQRQSGASLSLEETAQVRNQVWEQYIQDIIFRAEYDRHHIRAADAEIAEAIRLSPPRELAENALFQTDGKFDPAKYQRWLASTEGQAAVPYLEERYREEILRLKLMRSVVADVYLSDAAFWERYRDEKETAKFGVLVIDPNSAVADQAVSISGPEVEDYYRAHRDDFKQPRQAFLSYLAVARQPDASDTAAALARVRALREEIQKGAPFAEVAKRESSDTISGKNGGDLGEMSKSAVDPAFGAAAMSLPLKTLSEPVKSQFGFHLIEVDSRKGDSFKARHILVPVELVGAHRDLVDKRADSLQSLAADRLEPSGLDTAASALKLKIGHAGPVTEGGSVFTPEAGMVGDAAVWAAQAQKGEESPVIETPNAFLVFRLDSVQDAGIPPLERIRPAVEQRVRLAKKQAAAKDIGARLAAEARKGAGLKPLAQGPGLSYREVGPVSRLGTALPEPFLIGAAFSVGKGEISEPAAAEDGVYLFQGIERTPADSAEFAKNLPQLRNESLQAARQARVRAYAMALRAAAKIVDRRSDIYKTSAQTAAGAPTPVR